MRASLIIPAAGSGSRMQMSQNKAYLELRGKPVLAHTIARFHDFEEIEEIIIVAAGEEISFCNRQVVEPFKFHKVRHVVAGGPSRQDSVYNGIAQVSPDSTHIIIHDGARPFISTRDIRTFLDTLSGEEGVILGVPEKNTLKRVKGDYVEATLQREGVWEVQTPQGFKKELLEAAYRNLSSRLSEFTDDAAIAERANVRVRMVQGSYLNIKITTREDWLLGEKILELI